MNKERKKRKQRQPEFRQKVHVVIWFPDKFRVHSSTNMPVQDESRYHNVTDVEEDLTTLRFTDSKGIRHSTTCKWLVIRISEKGEVTL